MCEPVTISATASYAMATMAAMTAVSTAVSVAAQRQQAHNNQVAIDQAAKVRSEQVSAQASQEESVAVKAARQARAESIVAAGESGVNLGSNSFLASLQTTTMTQSENEGLILENEKNQELGIQANAQSELNSKAYSPSVFSGIVQTGMSAAGAYMSARGAENAGINKSTDQNWV